MYLKRIISQADLDRMRVNLSVRANMLDPDTPPDAPSRLSAEPVCDWCGDGEPVVTYAASRMASGEYRQCWRWNACEQCDRMVERGHWDALKRKVAARFKKFLGPKLKANFGHVPDAVIDEAVGESLKQFFDYAILEIDAAPGGGKTAPNTFTPDGAK